MYEEKMFMGETNFFPYMQLNKRSNSWYVKVKHLATVRLARAYITE